MTLVETTQIVPAILPLDLQTQRDGDWVSLKHYDHLTILFFKGTGTDGDDPTITLQQAQDASGTGAKALNFTDLWRKQAADLTTVAQFERVTQAAGNTYTNTDAHQQCLWVLEIDAAQLDVDEGFDHVRLTCSDTGTNAQLGCALYILSRARFPQPIPPGAL